MGFDPVAYINEPRWQESRLGLARIRALLERMGNPQNRLKFVHVAGTNGKGSVSAYLAAILQAAGYKVGLFTSPYIVEFNERIRVNGQNISMHDLIDVTLFVREHAEALCAQGAPGVSEDAVAPGEHPTEFELMTAVAFEHFARSACDIVVCEVGLGGRLDSTNIIADPEACVITRIGLDHTAILGDTLGQIAREKAAIIKPGAAVVAWPDDDPQVMRAIGLAAASAAAGLAQNRKAAEQQVAAVVDAAEMGAAAEVDAALPGADAAMGAAAAMGARPRSFKPLPIAALTRDVLVLPDFTQLQVGEVEGLCAESQAGSQAAAESAAAAEQFATDRLLRPFTYKGRTFATQLLGSYQPYNAALAIEAARALARREWQVSEQHIAQGIAAASWPGRFQVMKFEDVPLVIDGGHNPQGACALRDSLADVFPQVCAARRVIFVMGVLADKDYAAMIRAVLPVAKAFVCASPPSPRALSAQDLAAAIRDEIARAQAVQTDELLDIRASAPAASAPALEPTVEACASFADALECARAAAEPGDVICAFGSLYSIAEILQALR